ncbi:hypothetical protein CCACVL1_28899 [Corchorus capsularis]|uniref:Uncharacterized protein n=1 Tax=Corchorus capsularis TaxID=210143 RepID=A0A1R3G4R5_COCAP|nr:hypothetical protein CCACVL1_28899 [Corchorus capsularis]
MAEIIFKVVEMEDLPGEKTNINAYFSIVPKADNSGSAPAFYH